MNAARRPSAARYPAPVTMPRRTLKTLTLVLSTMLAFAALPVGALAQELVPIAVSDAFAHDGDAAGPDVEFAWTVSDPTARWQLELTGPEGERVSFSLHDSDGAKLGDSAAKDRAALRDLALPVGVYSVRVGRSNLEAFPFHLAASGEVDEFDPEPNDSADTAVVIGDGEQAVGRLARVSSDDDLYRLDIPSGEAMLRDVTLVSDGDVKRNLCIADSDGVNLQCRSGVTGAALPSLLLPAGAYFVSVGGSVDSEARYELAISEATPRMAAVEAEPNDSVPTASRFDVDAGVGGMSSREDEDFHEVWIEGEPQLWRVEVSGSPIVALEWVRSRAAVAHARPACNETMAAIDDLMLVPGPHRFMVRTCADEDGKPGAYELSMTPLGLPDPEAEREPNDHEERAEPYRLGDLRTGRLSRADDTDQFRFTLTDRTGLQLLLEQPPDADIDVRLASAGVDLFKVRASEPGATIDVPLWLPAGDYRLVMRALEPSDGTYALTTTWLDPLEVPADAEPNDYSGFARSIPATLRWEGGRSGQGQDTDGYWLPALSTAGAATIVVEGDRPWAKLFADDGTTQIEMEQSEPGIYTAAEAPVGVPLFLQVRADDRYAVSLDAPGWEAVPAAPDLQLESELTLATDVVAAYWTLGQEVPGSVRLHNTGSEPLSLDVEAGTTHPAWQAVLESETIEVSPGSSAEVGLSLLIQPDVWADAPVLVRVAATGPDGATLATTTEVVASTEADPVGSRVAWTVPDEMLGGLNVAASALGGVGAGTASPDREPFLFDELTPPTKGFGADIGEPPLELEVDLAGDSPLPVVGITLNPLAWNVTRDNVTREFELLLSADGQTWTSVLSDELAPVAIDQHFVLDEAVPATHAKLAIHSTHGRGDDRFTAIGEWKVIAEPGTDLYDAPVNIADPVLGGNIARSLPDLGSWGNQRQVLDENLKRSAHDGRSAGIQEGRVEIVVGFKEGRVAQITEIRWTDPDGTDETERLAQVDVMASEDGPFGPWTDLGEWDLTPAADGSVAPFALDEPVWARYVMLATEVDPEHFKRVEFPGRIEIDERAQDDEYRSILGEWGYTRDVGPYEWLNPPAMASLETGIDAGDTREDATPLALGEARTEAAEILVDPDWYRIEVPPDANTLVLDLEGEPAVGVGVTLFDGSGQLQDAAHERLPGGTERYSAEVEPGTYYAQLEQPPFNVVFTFDTSGSMGPFYDYVFEGMREFASDVRPGRETAKILPVDEPTLLPEWTDQPVALEAAVNAYHPIQQSSDILSGIETASSLLLGREGTRAILSVADGETGVNQGHRTWDAIERSQPTIYTVHVGANNNPRETRDMMRAWSDANGGVYTYPTTHAEMTRSFERMSTQLRRPAAYTLEASASFIDRSPATLRVIAPEGAAAALAPGVGVGIVLDTSGSMRKKLDGVPRIDVAKTSLRELISSGIAEGVPVSLRAFGGTGGGKAARCDTRGVQALAPLERAGALKLIKKLKADKKTKTPIAAALEAGAEDLAGVEGSRTIVFITDGNETCKGDPESAIATIRESGVDVNLNIVGFALDDEALKAQMAAWAEAGNGSYFDAAGADELSTALAAAVAAPYRVFSDDGDDPIAQSTVGGEDVMLEPGIYRVEVLTDPVVEFEDVELAGGGIASLRLPPPEE